ncbi:MAG: hypothetical protein FD135_2294 [Comamonadaceae bacterium]|nr:MAG: hypothetical protein FD135_2294 [Comamonadaceae bacterium]
MNTNDVAGIHFLSSRHLAVRPLFMLLRNRLVSAILILIAFASFAQSASSSSATTSEIYAPVKPGPAVILISGASGTQPYQAYATQLQKLGYYTLLIDGREILTREKDGLGYLKRTIAQSQNASAAVPGKVAVIGFSQGGGGALLHASTLRDQVSAVIAYYPAVSWSPNMNWLAERFAVPILVLAGEKDQYNSCCLIEDIRKLEVAATRKGARFELVSYPQAEHGFNLNIGTFNQADAEDAWSRTQKMLAERHPLSNAQ